MSILAITPYAGSKKLVDMTNNMLQQFASCVAKCKAEVVTVAINNKADCDVAKSLRDFHYWNEVNDGFGNAVNMVIWREIIDPPRLKLIKADGSEQPFGMAGFSPPYTHVLVLNNDLEFPDHSWLHELLSAIEDDLVLSPCTDITATKVAIATKAMDSIPVRASQVSAFCWLVPVTTIKMIHKKYGFPLFHPDFTNYGSDDVTGAILRGLLGSNPFKVVPRSFVKHLKGKTANELGIKPGQKDVLQRISNFKRARRLT